MGLFRDVLVVGLALGFAVFAQVNRTVAGDPGQQKPCELDRTIRVKMKYLLYLPKDYDTKESSPLLLFLHGAGERGMICKWSRSTGPRK